MSFYAMPCCAEQRRAASCCAVPCVSFPAARFRAMRACMRAIPCCAMPCVPTSMSFHASFAVRCCALPSHAKPRHATLWRACTRVSACVCVCACVRECAPSCMYACMMRTTGEIKTCRNDASFPYPSNDPGPSYISSRAPVKHFRSRESFSSSPTTLTGLSHQSPSSAGAAPPVRRPDRGTAPAMCRPTPSLALHRSISRLGFLQTRGMHCLE